MPFDETNIERGEFRDQVGLSRSIKIGEEDSEFEVVLAFLEDRTPRERDVEDWIRQDDLF